MLASLAGTLTHPDFLEHFLMPLPPLELPEDRRALVARLRGEIARGTYDTPQRMEAALDAFLDRPEGNFDTFSAKGSQGTS